MNMDSWKQLHVNGKEYEAIYNQDRLIWAKENQISGELPLSIYSRRGVIENYNLYGKTVQNGIPTPDTPIEVLGVGDRTANLFDKNAPDHVTTGYIKSDGTIQISTNFSTSGYISISGFETITLSGYGNGNEPAYCLYDSNKEYIGGLAYIGRTTISVTVGTAAYIRMSYQNTSVDSTMLNNGSTALPYEPYGYKIPISSANITTPIYLGEVQTTRKIKKLVLTGEETFVRNGSGDGAFYRMILSDMAQIDSLDNSLCSHFTYNVISSSNNDIGFFILSDGSALRIRPNDVSSSTLQTFTTWLAQQYAAGTPVTVWYVLETEEIGIVNEPLMKIGDYADTLSNEQAGQQIPITKGTNIITTDTLIKPTMSITYR